MELLNQTNDKDIKEELIKSIDQLETNKFEENFVETKFVEKFHLFQAQLNYYVRFNKNDSE